MDEYTVVSQDSELYHWGIKGMKWGVRRYQNKDGSLKPAGVKRYNKELEKLKAEKAKVSAELKKAKSEDAARKKTQSKLDKLDKEKQKLEEQKKLLNDLKKGKKTNDEPKVETLEDRKTRILNSHNAKEIYKNKDLFSDKEIQDAYLRLNNERNIKNLIPEDVNKGQQIIQRYSDFSKMTKSIIDSTSDLYNSYNKAEKIVTGIMKKLEKTAK